MTNVAMARKRGLLYIAADAVADETARLMGEATAEAMVIPYRA